MSKTTPTFDTQGIVDVARGVTPGYPRMRLLSMQFKIE